MTSQFEKIGSKPQYAPPKCRIVPELVWPDSMEPSDLNLLCSPFLFSSHPKAPIHSSFSTGIPKRASSVSSSTTLSRSQLDLCRSRPINLQLSLTTLLDFLSLPGNSPLTPDSPLSRNLFEFFSLCAIFLRKLNQLLPLNWNVVHPMFASFVHTTTASLFTFLNVIIYERSVSNLPLNAFEIGTFLKMFKFWVFSEKTDGFLEKNWCFLKFLEGGKFAVECVSSGKFS